MAEEVDLTRILGSVDDPDSVLVLANLKAMCIYAREVGDTKTADRLEVVLRDRMASAEAMTEDF